jgi:hypothetical protein
MQKHPPFKILLVIAASLALAACGSSSKSKSSSTSTPTSKPTALAISISESGKKATFTAPASTKGGVVNVTLQNKGKGPHSAQLASIGNHTPADVLKAAGGNKLPSWVRLVGGAPTVGPGQTGAGTIRMAAGNYVILDFGSMGNGRASCHLQRLVGRRPAEHRDHRNCRRARQGQVQVADQRASQGG